MKNKKLMAAIPMVATMVMPLTAFAATSYTTSTANVTNVESAITTDAETNTVNVSVTQGSTFSVTIPKTITLNGTVDAESNSATYDITVKGNIASNEVIKVIPDASFKMSDVNGVKSQIDATVTQEKQNFVDSAKKTAAYSTDKTYDTVSKDGATFSNAGTVAVSGLTAGSWSGTFNFAISLTTIA